MTQEEQERMQKVLNSAFILTNLLSKPREGDPTWWGLVERCMDQLTERIDKFRSGRG